MLDGIGFSAIGRLHLLQLLQQQARDEGIAVTFNRPVSDLSEFADADMIVGADGVSSLVRRSDEAAFGASLSYLTNRFAWFGTTKVFDTLSADLPRNRARADQRASLPLFADHEHVPGRMQREDIFRLRLRQNERGRNPRGAGAHFAQTLDGHPLISNRSIWRQFPIVHNERWSVGNKVILGDALHTAHFSIGSGTRLAIEDAIALARAIRAHPRDVPAALAAYRGAAKADPRQARHRRQCSAAWYENFGAHMALPPYDFAMSYLSRTGRMDIERIRKMAPKFVAE